MQPKKSPRARHSSSRPPLSFCAALDTLAVARASVRASCLAKEHQEGRSFAKMWTALGVSASGNGTGAARHGEDARTAHVEICRELTGVLAMLRTLWIIKSEANRVRRARAWLKPSSIPTSPCEGGEIICQALLERARNTDQRTCRAWTPENQQLESSHARERRTSLSVLMCTVHTVHAVYDPSIPAAVCERWKSTLPSPTQWK